MLFTFSLSTLLYRWCLRKEWTTDEFGLSEIHKSELDWDAQSKSCFISNQNCLWLVCLRSPVYSELNCYSYRCSKNVVVLMDRLQHRCEKYKHYLLPQELFQQFSPQLVSLLLRKVDLHLFRTRNVSVWALFRLVASLCKLSLKVKRRAKRSFVKQTKNTEPDPFHIEIGLYVLWVRVLSTPL